MNKRANKAAGGNAGERRSSARSNRGVWAALPGMPQPCRSAKPIEVGVGIGIGIGIGIERTCMGFGHERLRSTSNRMGIAYPGTIPIATPTPTAAGNER
jgi:hypothetical protein